MKGPDSYVVAGSKPWNRTVFDTIIRRYPGDWHFAATREELERAERINPRYVFFLHWSWKVPAEMVERYECVCFHMADVPYGRGGSPLQNLLLRGVRHTKLAALRMTGDVDAGPVYLKQDLCLEGGAEEIYIRAAQLSAEMIGRMIAEPIEPRVQSGEIVDFKRRRPGQSAIPPLAGLGALYDFIRMLVADGYPQAYLDHAGFRYRFRRAARYDGRIHADVIITPVEQEGQ